MAITELLELIRAKPNVMLAYKSVDSLYHFVQGYAFARKGTDEGASDYAYLASFDQWVRRRFRITSTQSWAQILFFFSKDNIDSFDLFYQLHDEFSNRMTK